MVDHTLSSVLANSEEDTKKLGQIIGANLIGGELIELVSDLGSGKTTLVKGLAYGAGSQEVVSSPSFTICNEYQAKTFTIYHFDFYRLQDPGIIKRQLAEVIGQPDGVVVIEWPNVVNNILPKDRLIIHIQVTKDGRRLIKLKTTAKLKYLINKPG